MSIDWSLVGPALMILGLLCLSGFFSGSETSLTATSRARMLQLEKDGAPAAGRASRRDVSGVPPMSTVDSASHRPPAG